MIAQTEDDLLADVAAEQRFARDIVASRGAALTPAGYRRAAAGIAAAGAAFQREDGSVWTARAVALLLREEACCIDAGRAEPRP